MMIKFIDKTLTVGVHFLMSYATRKAIIPETGVVSDPSLYMT